MSMKTCPVCGVEFQLTPKHPNVQYCSQQCAGIAKRQRITLICENCGKDFQVKPAQSHRRFCSQICSNQFNQPKTERKLCICEWCGKEFETWTCRQGRFCSRICASHYGARQPKLSARKPWNYVTVCCEVCGAEYIVHRCIIEKRHSRFCSIECRNKERSEAMMGHGNHNYKGGTEFPNRGPNWSTQRKRALKRDSGTCQICGRKAKKGEKRVIDVHHIIPYKEFNGDYLRANHLKNLITLCRSCHSEVEHHDKPCPVRLF